MEIHKVAEVKTIELHKSETQLRINRFQGRGTFGDAQAESIEWHNVAVQLLSLSNSTTAVRPPRLTISLV